LQAARTAPFLLIQQPFCINGLIGPDRVPHPHYYEVQHVYQPLQFVRESDGRIRIINRNSFTNPDEYV
jgi:beta-galactosidase